MTRDVQIYIFFNGIKRPGDKREPLCSIGTCRRGFTCNPPRHFATVRTYLHPSLPASRFLFGAIAKMLSLFAIRFRWLSRNAPFHFVFTLRGMNEMKSVG